jgi:chromosomal replication initiation ATPase DnaA
MEQVIEAVARKMCIDRQKLFSASRERRLALTRALIAWHVTQNHIATLTEVSRRLGRDPSSVYTAYMRYQMARPQLFREPLATLLKNLEKEEGSAR